MSLQKPPTNLSSLPFKHKSIFSTRLFLEESACVVIIKMLVKHCVFNVSYIFLDVKSELSLLHSMHEFFFFQNLMNQVYLERGRKCLAHGGLLFKDLTNVKRTQNFCMIL